MPSPDQHLIDELYRTLKGEDANGGNGHESGHANPGGSKLTDQAVLEKLFGERNGAKWRSVYYGNFEGYYPSLSEATAALLRKLAFYTNNDPVQMERLIRGSGLARPKFDSPRGSSTWLADEIAKAIADTAEPYAPPQNTKQNAHSRSRSLGNEVMSNEPEPKVQAVSFRGREKPAPREWLVEGAVCKGHAATWYGEGGIAKSLLSAHLALRLASPSFDEWAGLKIRTVPVLYGDFELDETEHLRRCQCLAAGMGLDDVPTEFHYLPLAGLPTDEAFGIAAEECERLGAGLFVVDSVGFALDGDSELAKDVLRFHRDYVQPIRHAGASPLLIDHQGKLIKGEKYSDKQEFGSVYKTNATRSSFQIRGSWDGSELTATFTHKKTNFGPKVEDFSLKVSFGRELIKVERLEQAVPNPDREPSKKEQVYAAIEELGRATAETACRKTGFNLQTVRNAISELLSEGMLRDTGEKQGRSRIVVTHSHTTQGTGTGTSEQRISRLVEEGMSEKWARKEVLGDQCHHGTPKGCPCDDCDVEARFGEGTRTVVLDDGTEGVVFG